MQILQSLADIKHQFLDLLISSGFLSLDVKTRSMMGHDRILEFTGPELNVNNENYKLLQGLICAALYPNVVKVFSPEFSDALSKESKTDKITLVTKENELVHIHPSSINSNVGHYSSAFLTFQERIGNFIKEVTVVPIIPLVFFSDYGIDIKFHNGNCEISLGDDGGITLSVESLRVCEIHFYLSDFNNASSNIIICIINIIF